MTEIGHNSASAEMLRGYVERFEELGGRKADISEDQKLVMAEAKAAGFVPKAIRKICKMRSMKPSDLAESEALIDTYRHALGMTADLPLFRHMDIAAVDTTKREEVIEALKKLCPSNGSIQVETADGKPVRLTRDKDGNVHVQEIFLTPAGSPDTKTLGGERRSSKQSAAVPDVNEDEALEMGRQAFKDDVPIIQNPFPFRDKRRARWDEGWRNASGTDGMGK